MLEKLSFVKPYLLTLLYLGVAIASFCQVQDKLLLNRITTLQGLSSNEVKCFYQDSRGFIWIGTFDGLNRYDGRNIKIYRRNIADTNSLISNWVNSIVEDKNGDVWVGTSAGVSRLNILSDKFTNYPVKILFPGRKSYAGEQMVFKGRNNKIWVSSGGLSYYDENTGEFVVQPFMGPTPVHKYNLNQLVVSTTVDGDGNYWFGTIDGLYRYNTVNKVYTRFDDNPETEAYVKHGDLLDNVVSYNNNQFLLTPWADKLYILNKDSNTLNPKSFVSLAGKFDLRLSKVQWNGKTEYWVSHNQGIVRFDDKLKKIEEWASSFDPKNTADALCGSVKCIFQSKEGILFIATTMGVTILNPYLQVFKTYYFPDIHSSFGTNAGSISTLAFENNKMFVGDWYSNALYVLDNKWSILKIIKTFGPISPTESSAGTNQVVKDKQGFLWIATFQGLVKLDPETFNFKIYLPDKNDTLFYRHKRFYKIVQDGDSVLWLVNYKQDLMSFDKRKEAFKLYQPFVPQRNIWGLTLANNKFWISADNFFGSFNPSGDSASLSPNLATTFPDYENVVQGKKDELWLTSTNGIWRLNTVTKEWHNWSSADGLCNDYVDKILFDKNGHLWITTFNGISAFDTTQKLFYNFTSQNGLPADNWTGALTMDDKGIMYLGSENAISFFDPAKAIRPANNYPAYITSCQVNGRDIPLPANDEGRKSIGLRYNENNLNFQFTVVNLLQPFQTSYYYKLEGFDTQWHLSSTGIINYTNLDPGHYILRVTSNPANVKASNNDAFYFTIHHPFWTTWWFITSLALLIMASIMYFFRTRVAHIRKEANRKAEISQQVADLRMKALRSQMNPHFLFNSLNAIQECCITGQIDIATQYLARFSKLVRFILENSGKQWVSLHEEIETLKLYLDVESLRFAGSFGYNIENSVALNTHLLKIPPMLVQPFVENAIWHGLMHKTGERHVWIRLSNNDEKLFIEIEDNGVGRSDKKKENHKSMGMDIVNERMKLIEEIQKSPASVEVIDKKDEQGKPLGTIVKLKLPLL